jgi:hypothetical protein
MDNQEKTEGAIKNGQFRKPGNTWYTKDEDKQHTNSAGITNPWFSSWFEVLYNCSLDATNMRTYTTVCDRNFLNWMFVLPSTLKVIALIFSTKRSPRSAAFL